MFFPLRSWPERSCYAGLIALMLAPVVAQGLNRPLVLLVGGQPGGAAITGAALAVALAGWLVTVAKEDAKPWRALGASVGVGVMLGLVLAVGLVGHLALVVSAASVVALLRFLIPRVPEALDGIAGRNRGLTIVYVLVALLSLVQVGRVTVFMADPTRTDAQVVPGLKFLETHSCLTAYVHANRLAHARVDNLYAAEHWPELRPGAQHEDTPYKPFDLDSYVYPPPFLLSTELLAPFMGSYLAQRVAWFLINSVLLGAALWVGARGFGGPRWHRPLLLAPLFFGSLSSLSSLQIGNAQAIVVVAAVLSLLAFESGRPAAGGFALAFSALAKISPGIFGLILVIQRRWRDVLWAAGAGALLLFLTLLAYGAAPFKAFLSYELPRLNSGEAFSFIFDHPESIAFNMAPAGIPFKLALLGWTIPDPLGASRWINRGFTVFIVALALVIGRRAPGSSPQAMNRQALSWMALLFLAALRGTFAPGYVTFSLVWALTLLSVEVENFRGGIGLLFLYLLLTIYPPLSPQLVSIYSMVVMPITLGVPLWLILRRS